MELVHLHHTVGWGMILLGLFVGSGLGMFFHQEDFLGGYTSFRRRLLRLGHIAMIALGMLNVIFSVWLPSASIEWTLPFASWLLLVGTFTMPTLCFLTAWRKAFRHGFALPVVALIAAVFLILIGGVS